MTGQLALTDTSPLLPGEWTSTGWGAQHQVRRSDEKWTELVCHAGEQRCETARMDRAADENERCGRCAALPDLGPLIRGPLGEVRYGPLGQVAIAVGGVVGSVNRWRLVGDDPQAGGHGWRTDWDVAAWTVRGNVLAHDDVDRPAAA